MQFIKEDIKNERDIKKIYNSQNTASEMVCFIKLFNRISFIKITKKGNTKGIFLFGFIPLLKIKEK